MLHPLVLRSAPRRCPCSTEMWGTDKKLRITERTMFGVCARSPKICQEQVLSAFDIGDQTPKQAGEGGLVLLGGGTVRWNMIRNNSELFKNLGPGHTAWRCLGSFAHTIRNKIPCSPHEARDRTGSCNCKQFCSVLYGGRGCHGPERAPDMTSGV